MKLLKENLCFKVTWPFSVGLQLDVRRMDGSLVQSGGLGASVNNALHIGWPAHSAPGAALGATHSAYVTSRAARNSDSTLWNV